MSLHLCIRNRRFVNHNILIRYHITFCRINHINTGNAVVWLGEWARRNKWKDSEDESWCGEMHRGLDEFEWVDADWVMGCGFEMAAGKVLGEVGLLLCWFKDTKAFWKWFLGTYSWWWHDSTADFIDITKSDSDIIRCFWVSKLCFQCRWRDCETFRHVFKSFWWNVRVMNPSVPLLLQRCAE